MAMEGDSLVARYSAILIVVSGYWIISIATVFVNKTLLSHIQLDAPMFIASYQTLITALICFGKKFISKMWPNKFSFPETNVWEINTIKMILPVSLLFAAMIATNNLCLKYVSVAFYYVGRSLTTIFNVTFTYFILGETTSKRSLFFCAVIISGFCLGVDQESIAGGWMYLLIQFSFADVAVYDFQFSQNCNIFRCVCLMRCQLTIRCLNILPFVRMLKGSLSVSGTIFGVLGSLSLSLFSIYTKRVLPRVNNEVWALSYYNNIYATILFLPLMMINNEFHELVNYEHLWSWYFWSIMTVGGICGFAIGFLTSLQIKYTSALTHNISGTAKACTQTVLATYWYQEAKSLLWWSSNFIVLLGSAGYARVKQLDMEKSYRQIPHYQKV